MTGGWVLRATISFFLLFGEPFPFFLFCLTFLTFERGIGGGERGLIFPLGHWFAASQLRAETGGPPGWSEVPVVPPRDAWGQAVGWGSGWGSSCFVARLITGYGSLTVLCYATVEIVVKEVRLGCMGCCFCRAGTVDRG